MPTLRAAFIIVSRFVTTVPYEPFGVLGPAKLRVDDTVTLFVMVRPKIAIIVGLKIACQRIQILISLRGEDHGRLLHTIMPSTSFGRVLSICKWLLALNANSQFVAGLSLACGTCSARGGPLELIDIAYRLHPDDFIVA